MIKLLDIANQVLKEQQQVDEASLKSKLIAPLFATAVATAAGGAAYLNRNKDLDKPISVDIQSQYEKANPGFSFFNLNEKKGIELYAEVCQAFIDKRSPNPLGITGDMMAKAAADVLKSTKKYVPPELALAQLVVEGGIGNDNKNSRPIKYKNPYNIGNVDSGKNRKFSSVYNAIKAYYELVATDYLSGQSPSNLISNFINTAGNRYASAASYESMLKSVANRAHSIADDIKKEATK